MSKTPVQKATPKTAPASLPPMPAKGAKTNAAVAAKTVAKAKPAAAPAAVASAVKPAPRPAPAAVAPAPVPAAQVATAIAPMKPRSRSAKALYVPVQAPLPLPTSRFADRFAPPRPPTRHMSKPELESPKHIHKHDPKLANAWKSKSAKELSEAELLAMPDAEYMNDKQLEFFRLKLQELKDDLLNNAGETTEHLREDTSIVPDPADRATIEEEHALELRTRDRERKLLKKISQSLARIESGEYGFCDETGEPIGIGRLIARPTATLSLEAQQRRELKQKLFGD
ncbi:MAG: RNA polymerase-binding protein DksA [Burkholderiaceae bacterium]